MGAIAPQSVSSRWYSVLFQADGGSGHTIDSSSRHPVQRSLQDSKGGNSTALLKELQMRAHSDAVSAFTSQRAKVCAIADQGNALDGGLQLQKAVCAFA